jgi:cell division protein ZapA
MESAPAKVPEARKSVRVTIYNQPYTLAATEEPGEVETLAQVVDELMTSVAQRAGNVDAQRIAVLACLHMADKLRTIETELSGLKDRVGRKALEFSILLDKAIE